ncbi:hypothetical protein ACGFMM_15575 [Streptomyces sp. NPDC048604]|uniref:hypothetical protein n=1 Tax=Streptomyces sp. NPDC048604 TaxID=3365578 RepID=UPI00372228AC
MLYDQPDWGNPMLSETKSMLASSEPRQVLVASWDALDVTRRVASTVTWEAGSDELQALAASQSCMAGRALLPLPGSGRPLEASVIEAGPEGLEPWVELLHEVRDALVRLSDGQSDEARAVLVAAAGHADAGAVALATVRGH